MVMTTRCSHAYAEAKSPLPSSVWETLDVESLGTIVADQLPTVSAVCTLEASSSVEDGVVKDEATTNTNTLSLLDINYGWKVLTVLGESPSATGATATSSGVDEKATGAPAQAGSGSETWGVQATSTQAARASEVTAWVNAVVVIAAGAAVMIV